VSGRPIRLAIGAVTPHTRRAIEAALRLAHATGRPVDCLFVEESELFDAASLPITRELGVVAGGARRFEPPDLARALERQAEQARRELAQHAQRQRVAWSFATARGRLLQSALERAGEDDTLVIGVPGLELEASLGGAAGDGGRDRLLAVVESLPRGLSTLRAALDALPRVPLTVWQRRSLEGARAAIDEALAALGRERGQPLQRFAPPHDGEPTVADVVGRLRPRLLAIEREALVATAPELWRALRRLGITVVAGPRDERG